MTDLEELVEDVHRTICGAMVIPESMIHPSFKPDYSRHKLSEEAFFKVIDSKAKAIMEQITWDGFCFSVVKSSYMARHHKSSSKRRVFKKWMNKVKNKKHSKIMCDKYVFLNNFEINWG